MAYTDLREFISRSGEARRTEADSLRSGPGAGDHRVRRPRGEARRPRAAVREAEGLDHPRPDQRLRQHAARWRSRSRSTRWTRSRGRISEYPRDAHAGGPDRQAQDAAQAGRDGSFFPKIVAERPVQGSDPAATASRCRLPDPAVLARRTAGAFITLPLVFTTQPRHRQAQLRHVPHAGLRRAHHRHALADPQAGRRALPPAAAGSGSEAHGGGRGHRRRPGHHVLRHPAAAAGPRRDDDRRLPARQAGRDGEVRDRATWRCPRKAEIVLEGYVELGELRTRRAVRRPHRLLLARQTTTRSSTSPASRSAKTRSTPPPSSARRPWRTTTWARPSSASSCR